MASEFRRGLPEGALPFLKGQSWWHDVLRHRYHDDQGRPHPLLIALRSGYLNVYAQGQSVLKVAFDSRSGSGVRLRAKLHRKYVRENEIGQAYFDFDGQRVIDPKTGQKVVEYRGPETLSRWVEAARSYAVGEKCGVALIAEQHPNVIDVEMGLPADEPTAAEKGKAAYRMDIVALEQSGDRIRLAFYEAKLFGNPELRAQNLQPRALEQLGRYRDYVLQPHRREQVLAAYKNTCAVLRDIDDMHSRMTDPLVRAVADGSDIDLDPSPRLIVFGYDEQYIASGSAWEPHQRVLRNAFTVIESPTAEQVRLVGA